MSHTYKIVTSQRMNIEEVIDELRSRRSPAFYNDRSPTYQVFEMGLSARGVEISEEDYGYEIRMVTLCNANDYLLCNTIAFYLCYRLKAGLTDEYGNEKNYRKLFYDKDICEIMSSDIKVLFSLLREGNSIDIFGPVREFSFGKRTAAKVLALQGDEHAVAYKLSKMITACQYPPENFAAFKNLLQVSSEDENFLVQVITNMGDMVIEKVKQYAIAAVDEEQILLTPQQLHSIVPEEWCFVDEYTILAGKLQAEQWKDFLEKAKLLGEAIL